MHSKEKHAPVDAQENIIESVTVNGKAAEISEKSIALSVIDFEGREYKEKPVSAPIRMVDTGNLLIGRGVSLVEISKAMANINRGGERLTFDIYSATVPDEKTLSYLNSNGCHFRGRVPKTQECAL